MKKNVKIYDNGATCEISAEEFDKRKKNGEKFVKLEGTEVQVSVSNEIYSEYMRPIWRDDKREKRSLKCIHKKYCTFGNCDSCTKYGYISDSLEFLTENGGIRLPSAESVEETFYKNLIFRELYEALSDLDEVNKKIFEMILDGESERTIAKCIGFKLSPSRKNGQKNRNKKRD